jgi:hypothetical protein
MTAEDSGKDSHSLDGPSHEPIMKKPGTRPGFLKCNTRHVGRMQPACQPKFLAAKSQFTRLVRKVSTNLGRALRWSM